MSEELDLLDATLARLFAEHVAKATADGGETSFDEALFRELEALGLPGLLVDEAQGGGGATFVEGRVLARAAGAHAIRVPLVETIVATRWLAAAGLERPAGPISIATRVEGALRLGGEPDGHVFEGRLSGVPWGARAIGVVFIADAEDGPCLVCVAPAAATDASARTNMAGEPRDTLRFDGAAVVAGRVEEGSRERLFDELALMRAGQMAGAMAAALDRSIRHASEREQFGRPIGKFQAVQQLLARAGGELAAVDCATRAAFQAAAAGRAEFEIACARLRTNLASELVVGAAHQVHGAIGFTRELDLRLFTTRLLAWRSECGNDVYWAERLGDSVAAHGAEAFWPDLTARADAVALASTGASV